MSSYVLARQLGGDATLMASLTTSIQAFSYPFTMPTTETNGRVSFNLGTNAEDVFIDNVVLAEAGGGDPDPDPDPDPNPSFSVRIEAESYSAMSGIQTESTSDAGGGQKIGYIDAGDWAAYANINIPAAGSYVVRYRVASNAGGGTMQLEGQGGAPVYGSVSVPGTGGWQNWTTVEHTVTLSAGLQNFGLAFTSGAYNVNWFEIETAPAARGGVASPEFSFVVPQPAVYPNPARETLTLAGMEGEFDRVQVLTPTGQQVLEQTLNGRGTETLNVANLQSGVYLLLFTGQQHRQSVRFLKQ